MKVRMLSRMALPANNWQSLGLHAGLVALAAGLTYVSEHMSGQDFGQYTALIVAGTTIILNYINKVIANDGSSVTPDVNVPVPFPVPVPSPVDPGNGVDFPIR